MNVSNFQYTIEAKPESASKPISVKYSMAALKRKGYEVTSSAELTLPIWGLYSNYINHIKIKIQYNDGSIGSLDLDISTPSYVDSNLIYDRPTFVKKRLPKTSLGFDFFYIKSRLGSPVIIDSDGEVRWTSTSTKDSGAAIFVGDGFIIGGTSAATIQKINLDGAIREFYLDAPVTYANFHHNIDPGKTGILGEIDQKIDGVKHWESLIVEFSDSGSIKKTWDFAKIIGDYMTSQGDDPSLFIRPGFDWMHINAAAYDPSDDSLVVSSRENFVIKVNYTSSKIIWIFGDPLKYWYTFPSLRALALQLPSGGLYPIGQHSISITSDGLLLLFNNGAASFNQPGGAPRGETRNYSLVSAYSINSELKTAKEEWIFDNNKSVISDICSSVYEAGDRSLLISYAVAGGYASGNAKAKIVGLDANKNIVFDFEYRDPPYCYTSWNAAPINLSNLVLE